jgi:hypothetical protein
MQCNIIAEDNIDNRRGTGPALSSAAIVASFSNHNQWRPRSCTLTEYKRRDSMTRDVGF